jgi:hypothetical protein
MVARAVLGDTMWVFFEAVATDLGNANAFCASVPYP